jgi:hypothetical protein
MGLTILILAFPLPSFKGATLGKGLNRMLATLSAGALGVGVHYLATLLGETGQPIVIGFFVFMIGTYICNKTLALFNIWETTLVSSN